MYMRSLRVLAMCLAIGCGGGGPGMDQPDGSRDGGPDTADARPLPTERPFISFRHLDQVSHTSAAYQRFETWVDTAVAGSPGYAYSPAHAVALYYLTNDTSYLDHAIAWVDGDVTLAEQTIAGGNRPAISGDSYLEVGDRIYELAVTFDYGYDRLTAEQRSRWTAYAEQAIWNVWNHEQASWGGQGHPWSGWSTDNPGNNYHFSFLRATMYWALASQNETWLALLRDDKLPALSAFWGAIAGGGSREGTGYGAAQRSLFELARVWRDSRGAEIEGVVAHALGTMDYWVHATVPGLDHFAPIGDQARSSMPELYDYHEHLVLEAAYLHPGTAAAQRAAWWLDNNSVGPMQSGFNAIHDLLPRPGSATQPGDTVYHATGVGNLFARTSFSGDAAWLAVVAGPYEESHAAQDQGGFTVYRNNWLAVTENVWSHSGIEQAVEMNNVVRFVSAGGTTINQNHGVSSMSYQQDETGVVIDANLDAAYSNSDAVTSWRRQLELGASRLRIADTFSVAGGVEAVWQLNVPVQPVIDGNAIQAGALRITPISPATPDITIIDWAATGDGLNAGYKIELRGGTSYEVELTW